jgi:hypothetical protein
MPCLRCAAERVSTGSGRVLPALRKRIPLSRFSAKVRFLVMPAVLAGLLILPFIKPVSMWVLVSVWVFVAYRLGRVRHIHEEESAAEEQQDFSRDSSSEGEEHKSEKLPENATSHFGH